MDLDLIVHKPDSDFCVQMITEFNELDAMLRTYVALQIESSRG